MKLTPEQHAAITTRNVSIGLSSGAGCGKTFVLTQRLLAHLAEGGSLSELAAITFTERAAREMRDRVRAEIHSNLASATSAEDRKVWQQHARELESARISTIHAFCGSFLRANAVAAGLDPNFATLDQAQAESLLSTVIDDELRRWLAERSEDAIGLIIVFALRDVIAMIRAMLEKRADLDLDAWQSATADELIDRWEVYFKTEYLPRQLQELAGSESCQEALDVLTTYRSTNKKMEVFRTNVLRLLPALAKSKNISADLAELIENARVQGGGGAKAWDSPEIYESVKRGMTNVRNSAKKLLENGDFDREAARNAAENGLRLLRVTIPIIAEYTRRKRELSALDFEDLLILTRDLLRDPQHANLRKRAAAGLKLLLVDELQDTDPLQIELVKTLCDDNLADGSLFVVGDYKQSIYRFRGADPRVFRQLLSDLPAAGRMSLTKSFRSQPCVLDFVNAMFHEPFSPEYECLEAHRDQSVPGTSTEFIWALEQDEELSADQARRAEASLIAQRIREMLEGGERVVVDRQKERNGETATRAVREEDIALLFRALSDVQYYEEALRREGIKYYLVGGHAFYAQQEIYDILNVLRTLAYPDDQVAAIGALRSPLFSISDETFYWLFRDAHGFRSVIFGDVPPPEQLDKDQRRQVTFAARTLRELRELKDRVSISTLMEEVLRRTGYDATLLGEFLGERKLANIRKLVDQARSFQSSDGFALDDFISRLAEFVASQPREALAAIHPESAGVVRLMTIHQAKGLEFPVVFVPDLDRRELNYTPRALFHPQLGPLVRQHRDEKNKTATGLAMIREEEVAEERSESTRLFYVATTRAADYLVLSSSLEAVDKLHGPWTKFLDERFDLRSGQFKGNVPEGWAVPEARVFAPKNAEETRTRRPRRVSIPNLVADVRQNLPKPHVVVGRAVPAVPADESARREFSFSGLSGALLEAPRDLPEEDTDLELTVANRDAALALGSLVHTVLERADFSQPESLAAHLAQLADERRDISPAQRSDAQAMLNNLLQTSLPQRIAVAQCVEREVDFVLPLAHDTSSTTGLYLRGVIDLLYQDVSGDWHIVDYKTNNVSVGQVPQLAAAYELQMYVYAQAVQSILGVAPASTTLAYLRPGVEHTLEFSAEDDRRLAGSLSLAIGRLVSEKVRENQSASRGDRSTAPIGQSLLSDESRSDSQGPPPPFSLKAETRRRVTRKR